MKPFKERNRFLIAPLFLVAFAAFGFVTMFLWNALMPGIFHLPQISFWQSIGLLILSRLLFGFSGPWRGRHNHRIGHLREKWEQMDPQAREEFKEHLREHRHLWTERRNNRTSQENPENKI